MADSSSESHDVILPGRLEYFPVLFTPAHQRGNVRAVLNISDKWRRIVTRANEPSIARIKLAWWEEEIQASKHGQVRHPLMPTHPGFTSGTLETLEHLLCAYITCLEKPEYTNSSENRNYAYGRLTQLAISQEQSETTDEDISKFANQLGLAWELHREVLSHGGSSVENLGDIASLGLEQLKTHGSRQRYWPTQRFGVILSALLRSWFKRLEQAKYADMPKISLFRQLMTSWRTALQCR